MIVNPSMLMPAISEQIAVLLRALLLGIFLGVMYDVFRVTRVFTGIRYSGAVKKLWDKNLPFISLYSVGRETTVTDKIKNAAVCAGDILFSVSAGIAVSVFIYRYCYGIVRWYVFFGAFLGFTSYYFTVGRVVLTVAEFIMFLLVTVVKYVFYFLSRPFVLAFYKAKKFIIELKYKKSVKKAEEK